MKRISIFTLVILICGSVYSQNAQNTEHNLKKYLENIVSGEQPKNKTVNVNYKFIKLDRSFTYVEKLIKGYKYSDQVFDKLGFGKIDKNTFRRCKDNLIVHRYGKRDGIIIMINWYNDEMKAETYLVFCK